jgi:hypothetical protein
MSWQREIATQGYTLVPGVFDGDKCRRTAERLVTALAACPDETAALKRTNGAIYGARNLLDLFPEAAQLWRRPPLVELLSAVLGPRFGLVRGLFFDKPPGGSWSLPWHRDLTIAVAEHLPAAEPFCNPTTKAGVPHVEAPDEVLAKMLTLRIHLDDATPKNGPLQVIPGSHTGRNSPADQPPQTILAQSGDVLAMRPLLLHASGEAAEGTMQHRRVMHLEFAAEERLPEGYRWQRFVKWPTLLASE